VNTLRSNCARLLVALAAATGLPAPAAPNVPGVTAGEILVGQDIDLSGTIAVRMKPLVAAADAYLERVNAAGGVNGRRIRVIRTDNANKPDRTKENVKALVEKEGVFTMWGISGTGNVGVALPYLEERGVPLVGSTSGADPFYVKRHPMLINLKAGYGDEIRRMAQHLKETFASKVGIIYLDNGFGRAAFKSAEAAVKDRGLDLVAAGRAREGDRELAGVVAASLEDRDDAPALDLTEAEERGVRRLRSARSLGAATSPDRVGDVDDDRLERGELGGDVEVVPELDAIEARPGEADDDGGFPVRCHGVSSVSSGAGVRLLRGQRGSTRS